MHSISHNPWSRLRARRLSSGMSNAFPAPAVDEIPSEPEAAAPARPSRIARLVVWAMACLGLASLAWWRFGGGTAATAPGYRTAVVRRGEITATVSASGPLSAVSTVNVGSQVSGNISRVHVDFNDRVAVGQLLAEIEPSSYEAALAQADGDLANARAALELRQLAAGRAGVLMEKSLIAQADYDQAMAELHQQQALVRIKEAAQKTAAINLGRTKIYSPIDGVVIDRTIDVGQTVQANFAAPTLFVLAQDLRQMQVTANVSEADIGSVAPGEVVSFTVDAFSGQTFRGEVQQVRNNSTITNNVVTYATMISVDNAELKLRPGMTANVVITTAHRSGVLRVPNAALRFHPQDGAAAETARPSGSRHTLYVTRAAAAAGSRGEATLSPVAVETGLSDSAYSEIVSGIEEGATVITGIAPVGEAAGDEATRNPFMPRLPTGRSTGR